MSEESLKLWRDKARKIIMETEPQLFKLKQLLKQGEGLDTNLLKRVNRKYPREPGQKGPSIIVCESCGVKGPVLALGLCKRCYQREWIRKKRARQRRATEMVFERKRRQSQKKPT